MKLIGKIFLTIIMVPLFVLFMISINIRFQFLSANFWTNTFERGGVYLQLSLYLKNKLESNVVAEGGKLSDIATLSNLLSEDSIKRFVEDNLTGFVNYTNGRTKELIVSVPFTATSLPEGFGVSDLGSTSQHMTLSGLLKQYQIRGITDAQIESMSKYGYYSWLFTIVVFVLFTGTVILQYLLTDHGRRLVALGIGLLIGGLFALAMSYFGHYMGQTFASGFVGSSNMATSIAAILIQSLSKNIVEIWLFFGISASVIGILLFFVRKPANNKSKQSL